MSAADADAPRVRVEVTDGVATVALDDPPRRNALTVRLVDELHTAADRTDARAFVLTGAGGTFCAGADVAELASGHWRDPEPNGPPLLFRRLTEDPRPWIAAVEGRALGGGAELALSCDFMVLSPDGSLRLPEAGLGVVPNTATALLHQRLPRQLAMSVLLGRAPITAERAVELGLATAMHPTETLLHEARGLARGVLASVSPTAFRLVKAAVHRETPMTWSDAARLLADCDDEDVTEGIAAMRERRRLDFTDRW